VDGVLENSLTELWSGSVSFAECNRGVRRWMGRLLRESVKLLSMVRAK
jgi:hypothetical protein